MYAALDSGHVDLVVGTHYVLDGDSGNLSTRRGGILWLR